MGQFEKLSIKWKLKLIIMSATMRVEDFLGRSAADARVK